MHYPHHMLFIVLRTMNRDKVMWHILKKWLLTDNIINSQFKDKDDMINL